MKVIKFLLNIFSLFCLMLIIIEGSYIYQVVVKHKTYANIFGYSLFTIGSGSMEPTIQIGDDILVKINDNYEIGDIVVFKDDDVLVSHRVIDINENLITTKGDNNNTEDESFDKSLVIGKVIKIVPKFGVIKSFLRQPIVFIIIANVILMSTMYLNFSKDISGKIKKQNN